MRRPHLLPPAPLAAPAPWVLAIMTGLALVCAAAGLGLGRTVERFDQGFDQRLTVQVIEPFGPERERQAQAALRALRAMPGLAGVTRVPGDDLMRGLQPWLGRLGAADELPVPALIEMTAVEARAADVAQRLAAVAPAARVDVAGRRLGRLRDLLRALQLVAAVAVGLMLTVTVAAVVLAVRGSFDQHRATVDLLHLLGATDGQLLRLFERRVVRDAGLGVAVGSLVGVGAILFVAERLTLVRAGLAEGVVFGPLDWLGLLLLPVASLGLAVAVARATVRRALERQL